MATKNDKSWGGYGSWSKMMDAKNQKKEANVQARNSAYVQRLRDPNNKFYFRDDSEDY